MSTDFDADIATFAEAHHGILSFQLLQELKVSENERRHRLASRRWEAPYELVYRIAGAPRSWKGDLLAACWAGGTRAVASHRSAAELWELPGRRLDIIAV